MLISFSPHLRFAESFELLRESSVWILYHLREVFAGILESDGKKYGSLPFPSSSSSVQPAREMLFARGLYISTHSRIPSIPGGFGFALTIWSSETKGSMGISSGTFSEYFPRTEMRNRVSPKSHSVSITRRSTVYSPVPYFIAEGFAFVPVSPFPKSQR